MMEKFSLEIILSSVIVDFEKLIFLNMSQHVTADHKNISQK